MILMRMGPHSGVMVGMAGLQGPGGVQVWTLAFREGRGSGLQQGSVGFETQLDIFCLVQRRGRYFIARDRLRNTLGYPED